MTALAKIAFSSSAADSYCHYYGWPFQQAQTSQNRIDITIKLALVCREQCAATKATSCIEAHMDIITMAI